MTRPVNIHASCVRWHGKGILLLGRSGAGKSDLALRLIAGGAVLVADDRCDLSIARGTLQVRAPRTIAGKLEVRGLGIVALPHMAARVALVVDLSAPVERMPERRTYVPPAPLELRQSAQPLLIALNAFETSAVAKIAASLGLLAAKNPGPVKRRGAAVKRI
ncbi:MAG TPA: HPr kinase/phosphatase C-terminal domain-containing protein [Rhizomicrobium sp.]